MSTLAIYHSAIMNMPHRLHWGKSLGNLCLNLVSGSFGFQNYLFVLRLVFSYLPFLVSGRSINSFKEYLRYCEQKEEEEEERKLPLP